LEHLAEASDLTSARLRTEPATAAEYIAVFSGCLLELAKSHLQLEEALRHGALLPTKDGA
jgi:hypothetical protein